MIHVLYWKTEISFQGDQQRDHPKIKKQKRKKEKEKKEIVLSFTPLHVVSNLYDFVFSVKHKRLYCEECTVYQMFLYIGSLGFNTG